MKNPNRFLILRTFFVATAVALLASGFTSWSAGAAEPDAGAQATYVGEKVCKNCHDTENKLFGHTLHANVFRQNPRNEVERTVCEACHGAGSNHVKNATDKSAMISFSKEWGTPIAKQNAQCMTCHSGGQRMHWQGSIHQTNKLGCSDCHNPMARFSANGALKKSSITETCQSCHQQQRAEFRKRSHMPVPEGKMTCEDCHNPHGSTTRPLLKADSVNDLCYICHAEKRGPFLWEHAPVRENCMNCHNAHGSNHDKLLNAARPMLCQGCHSGSGNMGHQLFGANLSGAILGGNIASQNPTAATLAGGARVSSHSCNNCHSQIHGSNSPGGARFQR